jgi:hypothetical protein
MKHSSFISKAKYCDLTEEHFAVRSVKQDAEEI